MNVIDYTISARKGLNSDDLNTYRLASKLVKSYDLHLPHRNY